MMRFLQVYQFPLPDLLLQYPETFPIKQRRQNSILKKEKKTKVEKKWNRWCQFFEGLTLKVNT